MDVDGEGVSVAHIHSRFMAGKVIGAKELLL